ncbi:hypothetical protein FHG87_023415 [Trinorchestia longiramus]|nr:hypothetical protein FHG87_023415 [Trinorchestia longiramus]
MSYVASVLLLDFKESYVLNCCHNGKVRLPYLQRCPLLLRRLLECDNHEARNYRDNIKNYYAAFSFASVGADVIMPPGREPYCFRLQGQTYNFSSGLHPNNDERRKYEQVYNLDTDEGIQTRSEAPENIACLESVFASISTIMEQNPYAQIHIKECL